jgi:hypothetical protein
MAAAMSAMLRSAPMRRAFAERLHHRVARLYGADAVLADICRVYDAALA